VSRLNYDPRPPERQLERQDEERTEKVADALIGFGQLAIALGVTIFAIVLLISLI
jgi:hypothetical protein